MRVSALSVVLLVAVAFVWACSGDSPPADTGMESEVATADVPADVPADVETGISQEAEAPDDVAAEAESSADTGEDEGVAIDGTSDEGVAIDGTSDEGVAIDGTSDEGVETGVAYPGWDLASRWKPAAAPACASPHNPTAKTLKQKAEYFDWIGGRLHLVPASVRPYSLVHDVTLDAPVPTGIVADGQVPNVTEYHYGENHGLWSSLFVASQAFRYAVTKDPVALDVLRRSFTGLYHAMKITGVPGIFTREYRDDSLPGDSCPAEGAEYAKPVDRAGNRWVKLDADACSWYWDPAAGGGAGAMVKDDPPHCVDPMYANLCWQRNCSKDESSGHNFAAAVVFSIVDDPELKAMAAEILGALATHLVDHAYRLVDFDGIATRYGSYYALSLDEFPGFNAIHALAATRSGLAATQDPKLRDAYVNCLLQANGQLQCIDEPIEWDSPGDYRGYMADNLGINLGCKLNNYDNVNMALLNYLILMFSEGDPALRANYRHSFLANTKGPDASGQDHWAELNPHWNFLMTALLEAGDAATFGPLIDEARAVALVGDGICTLQAFPETNIQVARDTTNHPETCVSDRHGSLTDQPVPIEERCASLFGWWGSPYERQVCGADPTQAMIPSGYLLPYWSGRYFGFLTDAM